MKIGKVSIDMDGVSQHPGFKWMLDEFVEAMNQQEVFERVDIVNFRDGRITIFFFADYDKRDGWYITGSSILSVVGSN